MFFKHKIQADTHMEGDWFLLFFDPKRSLYSQEILWANFYRQANQW